MYVQIYLNRILLLFDKLNPIITEYGLTIPAQKTKSMAFKGRDPVRTKL